MARFVLSPLDSQKPDRQAGRSGCRPGRTSAPRGGAIHCARRRRSFYLSPEVVDSL